MVWYIIFKAINAPEALVVGQDSVPQASLVLIQDNSLVSVSPVEFPHIQVLASKIAFCESGDNPTAKNPKSTAFGRCQFINSTWLYVQQKWDIKLDRYNADDQMYACIRLLEEEGADKHWQESKLCWSK